MVRDMKNESYKMVLFRIWILTTSFSSDLKSVSSLSRYGENDHDKYNGQVCSRTSI